MTRIINLDIIKSTVTIAVLLTLFVLQLPETIAASYIVGAIILLFSGSKVQFSNRQIGRYSLLCLLILVPALTFNHGATPLFYIVVSPFLFLLANEFSKQSLETVQGALKSLYWLFVGAISIALIVYWEEPEPLGSVLPWTSTNGIPSYLIVVQIAYSLSYYLKYNRLPLTSSVVTLIIAVLGLGRGSMIVGFLLLSLSLLINLTIATSKNGRIGVLIFALAAAVPLMTYSIENVGEISEAIDIWIDGSKFSEGVLDEHRARIWSDYIGKIDGLELLLGTNYERTSINEHYGGNPHNSYIRVHSFYGLFGLVIVFAPLLALCASRKVLSQKVVFFLLISLALFRATSEPIFFPSTLDYFYALYFFLFFRFSKPNLMPS